MLFIIFILLFIVGSSIGSFLTIVIDRLPRGESVFWGRSHCDNCKKQLGPFDLIPILSFFLLKRCCRYCKKKIGWHYPFLEAVTGIVFVCVGLPLFVLGLNIGTLLGFLPLVYSLFLLSCFIVLFFIDLFYGILPFSVIAIMMAATFLLYLLKYFYPSNLLLSVSLPNALLSALGTFLFFLMLFFITKKKGMGFGDVVYAFFMGFVLGFPKIVIGLYVAFLTGAFISLILIVTKRKKLRGGSVPFGPFLVAGTIVALFWGEGLLTVFSRFFNLY